MSHRDCYECRHLRLKGVPFSGEEYFICLLDKCHRDPYGFDSRACEHWAKCRLPRKVRKAIKRRRKLLKQDFNESLPF